MCHDLATKVWLNISPSRRLCAHRSEVHSFAYALSLLVMLVNGMAKETTLILQAQEVLHRFFRLPFMISQGVKCAVR
jgi:hypothetical protein